MKSEQEQEIEKLLKEGIEIRTGDVLPAGAGFTNYVEAYDALETYLNKCKEIDYVNIDISEEESYNIRIYECPNGYVFYLSGNIADMSLVMAQSVKDINEAYRMWNDELQTIADDIRELADNYAGEIHEKLKELAEEIETHKRRVE